MLSSFFQFFYSKRFSFIELVPLENPGTSQSCLDGEKYAQTGISSYHCQCPLDFDSEHCELDARVCQTQQPCDQ